MTTCMTKTELLRLVGEKPELHSFPPVGPTLPISKEVHSTKYCGPNETFEGAMRRVARTLSDSSTHQSALEDILLNQRFLPAGRIQAAIGASRKTTPLNCLDGSTEIVTREYGVIAISEVVGKTVHIIDGLGNWVAAEIREFGVQPVYRIQFSATRNGRPLVEVLATAEHAWIVDGDRIETSRLASKKMRVEHLTVRRTAMNEQEYELGVRHGFIYGDGTKVIPKNERWSFTPSYCVRVCEGKEEVAAFFEGVPVSYPPSFEGDALYMLHGQNITAAFKELPDPIQVSDSYLTGFVRGWFAADGCVSEVSDVTLCVGVHEEEWLRRWGPVVGFIPMGSSSLKDETNFGLRNKPVANLRFSRHGLSTDDFLRTKHAERFVPLEMEGWGIRGVSAEPEKVTTVYCAVVPTTHSFALASGIHSGNCYVSGTIEDNSDSIMKRAHEAFTTMRLGGGIGYDFSNIRPEGDVIHSLQSTASGPLSFMRIYDAVCATVRSAGHRRGAQMAVLRVDHPDIEKFVVAKHDQSSLTNFNVSVGITDEFMTAVRNDTSFTFRFNGKSYGSRRARDLWNLIMESTWDWAEPGVLFLDTINNMNNLWYTETLCATNPCGEQPLPPYGACLLGSVNLVKYVDRDSRTINLSRIERDLQPIVRAMDNVHDVATFPLPEQRKEAQDKRRMGIGITGLANALEAIGYAYGSAEFRHHQAIIQHKIMETCYWTSVELAQEKGAFPMFDKDLYLQSKFIQRLSPELQLAIYSNGIRNSHLTSVAPSGTISLTADNVSSGIEPVFCHSYERQIHMPDGIRTETVDDYGVREFGVYGKTAAEVTVDEHVGVLITASKYVDSAVSKTCNVGSDVSFEQFKDIYMKAWLGGARGCTTFRADGKRMGILKAKTEETPAEEGGACVYDPSTGVRTCDQ